MGAGPLIVIDTEVVGSQRSNPAYNRSASSTVNTETPLSPILP